MREHFDTAPDVRGFGNNKWDRMEEFCGVASEDGIAMWVADMDFAAPPAIRRALEAEAARGYFGYGGDLAATSVAVQRWLADQHGWQIDPGHVTFTHGVVAGFGTALHAYSEPGDRVILFTPVYHAFFRKAGNLGREVLQSELVLRDGRYEMDLEALEGQLNGRERILVLCQPHNPGGRIWSAGEIRELAAFCDKHDLILLSDEIHMDLTFPGVAHIPAATAAPEAKERTVVLTAASKGFNIAGGETGIAIIEAPALRARFLEAHAYIGGTPNRFGPLMIRTAFLECGDWSVAVRAYLDENFRLWSAHINAIPGLSVMDMPSTYLSWVDFSGTGLSREDVDARVVGQARIGKSAGPSFGAGGETWDRFNLAMPQSRLREAIARMEEAFSDLQ